MGSITTVHAYFSERGHCCHRRRRKCWFGLGGWLSCRWGEVGGGDEMNHRSYISTECRDAFIVQGYLLFIGLGIFPHTHNASVSSWKKSHCADVLNQAKALLHVIFCIHQIGSFLSKYQTAVTHSRGLFAHLRQTHKDQRFNVEWLERQMKTL